MWIDSHCHLNHAHAAPLGSPLDIANHAFENGVSGLLTISCRISKEYNVLRSIASSDPRIWCSMGTHPHDSGKAEEIAFSKQQLVDMALADKKIIAIGETGLDYHYNYSSPADQVASFTKHLDVAIECDLPVIIHTREAEEDTFTILKEASLSARQRGKTLRGVLHCFSSKRWLAERALGELDFYISFSGMITFGKKAEELEAIARDVVPINRLLVETDAPFLAPAPHRGQISSPAFVPYVGAHIASIKELTSDEIALATNLNFKHLMQIS